MRTVLHWFRRDLRLTDNTALNAAAKAAQVIPVYVLSDWETRHRWTGAHRQSFLCDSLDALSRNIEAVGGCLIFRKGPAPEELARLVRETSAEAVYFNRDPDPYGRKMEEQLAALGRENGFHTKGFKDVCLHEAGEVLTAAGKPFQVYTPYAKAWEALPKDKPGDRVQSLKAFPQLASLAAPTLDTWKLNGSSVTDMRGGERAARERMKNFAKTKLPDYGARRDFPSAEATSRLSQDLRFGLISIRELFAICHSVCEGLSADARRNARKFIGELIWREFYMHILWHHPEVLRQEFNPRYRGMAWTFDEGKLARWQAGETGFPIVDAGMRELAATGFMHNRVRMITAMFLTKDLHLDWRLGEEYFMRQLVDGEIASNNGGWQWSAGTGADAAPYFRVQNPWTQTARYDPDGAYIKRWIPELQGVSASDLAQPPPRGCSVAPGYPKPMVDHAQEREVTLRQFRDYGVRELPGRFTIVKTSTQKV